MVGWMWDVGRRSRHPKDKIRGAEADASTCRTSNILDIKTPSRRPISQVLGIRAQSDRTLLWVAGFFCRTF